MSGEAQTQRELGEISSSLKSINEKMDRLIWRQDQQEDRLEALEKFYAEGETWRLIRKRGIFVGVALILGAFFKSIVDGGILK